MPVMEASQIIHGTLDFSSVRDGSRGREDQTPRSPDRGLPSPCSLNLQFIPHQRAMGLPIPGHLREKNMVSSQGTVTAGGQVGISRDTSRGNFRTQRG